jgi:transposase
LAGGPGPESVCRARYYPADFTTATKIQGTMKTFARPGTMMMPETRRSRHKREEARKEMLYVGVDAHKAHSQLTVMDETGTVLERRRAASSREGMLEALEPHRRDEEDHTRREPMKAVLEAGYGWGPLYDWLCEIADEVVLAHPLKVRAIAEARIKTDKLDSEMLAHLLRADLIPEAYAPSKEVRATKRVLRQRMFLVRLRTMLKNRLRALLAQHGISPPPVSDLLGRKGLAWLKEEEPKLPDPDGWLLREEVKLAEVLKERIGSTESLIAQLASGDEAVRWLRSLPGVGAFLSVLIRHEVGEIDRFKSAKKFASYTGLVPSTYASGKRIAHGRLTKEGNKWLRWAFVEAVSPAVRSSPYLRGYYTRIKARRGTKDARTATARKLAELAWTVWTERRPYEEER